MSENQVILTANERAVMLAEIQGTDAYEHLSRELTDDHIIYIYRVFGHGIADCCGRCWNEGEFCCYECAEPSPP